MLRFRRPQVERADVESLAAAVRGDGAERRGFHGHEAHDFKVGEPVGHLCQSSHQVLGLAAGRTNENTLARPDMSDRRFGRATLFDITVRPVCAVCHV
ncbi:hypothetical protein DESC_780417 [Desulfosarcina cetonica]|nr:hypothetical protein DESC_780417 [Desulfosarcina cetonica]